MAKNNFKELEKLLIENRGNNSNKIKNNINSNINLFSFVSNLVELYIPKMGKVFTSFDNSKDNSKP